MKLYVVRTIQVALTRCVSVPASVSSIISLLGATTFLSVRVLRLHVRPSPLPFAELEYYGAWLGTTGKAACAGKICLWNAWSLVGRSTKSSHNGILTSQF
jgi:hypothetical protein